MATFLLVTAAVVGATAAVVSSVEQQKQAEEQAKQVGSAAKNEQLQRLKHLNKQLAAQRVGVAVSGIAQSSGSNIAAVEAENRQYRIAQGQSATATAIERARLKTQGRGAMVGGVVGATAQLSAAGSDWFILHGGGGK